MPNMYASAVCSGKVTPGGKKRTKKADGGTVKKTDSKIKRAGKIYDKKLKKYLGSKETQLHADSFEKGNERAESRAGLETMAKYKKMAKGGIARGCGKIMSNRRKKTKYI